MKHGNIAIFVPHLGCPNRCSFCDQNSISGSGEPVTPRQVEEICRGALAHMGEESRNAEIAFFGGSFTAIEKGYMVSLLEATAPFVGASGFMGIRVSTRPDAIDEEILHILKSFGVTSVELGAQSMVDEVLTANLRGHTADDVVKASALIQEAGFSLGLQMMLGLYQDDEQKDLYTGERLIALAPDTIRIYPTIVIEGTLLGRLFLEGCYHPMALDQAADLSAKLMLGFMNAGIHVIKVGLHASELLESQMLAGPYHPAFRELCEGKIMLQRLCDQIKASGCFPREIEVHINPADRSRMTGHKEVNRNALQQMGYRIKIVDGYNGGQAISVAVKLIYSLCPACGGKENRMLRDITVPPTFIHCCQFDLFSSPLCGGKENRMLRDITVPRLYPLLSI